MKLTIKKWSPKNVRDSMYPTLILNWIVGLGILDYPVGNSRNNFFIIPILLIAFLLWITNYQILSGLKCFPYGLYTLPLKLFYVAKQVITLNATYSIFSGWYYRKKMQLITENLDRMDQVFECLGLTRTNKCKEFKKNLYITIVCCIIILSSYIAHMSVRDYSIGNFSKAFWCTFSYQWPYYICTVLNLTFLSSLHCIGTKFRNINNLLQRKFYDNLNQYHFDNYQFYETSLDWVESKNTLELIRHIYLELCKVSRQINRIYGVFLTLNMVVNFCTFTASLFSIIFLAYSPLGTIRTKLYIPLLDHSVLSFYNIVIVNVACSLTCHQSKKTAEILLDMKILKRNLEIRREIDQFHQQIDLQTLTFTICGFNTLGYKFIFHVLGAMITYLMILVQLGL